MKLRLFKQRKEKNSKTCHLVEKSHKIAGAILPSNLWKSNKKCLVNSSQFTTKRTELANNCKDCSLRTPMRLELLTQMKMI